MSSQPIENLLPKAGGSIYRLVRMASTRALELSEGKRCLLENLDTDKVTTKALLEIEEGKIVSKEGLECLAVKDGTEEGKEETDEEVLSHSG